MWWAWKNNNNNNNLEEDWAHLDTQGICNSAEELDVSTVELSSALADPQHVCRAVVPQASGGILASERLFVRKQETLMRGVELRCPHHGMIGSQSRRGHKPQSFIHMVRQIPIPDKKKQKKFNAPVLQDLSSTKDHVTLNLTKCKSSTRSKT